MSSLSRKRARSPPPKPLASINEAPISKKVSGAETYTSMHYKRDERMNDFGTEMVGKFAGPIAPERFLQTFLPFKQNQLTGMPNRREDTFQKVADATSEVDMYDPMIVALEPYCNGFDLVNTHGHPDKNLDKNDPEVKPDVCLYGPGSRPDWITDISLVEVPIEFKLGPNDDAFCDDDSGVPFEHTSAQSIDTRSQITCYTTMQLATQYRTHAFSVLICKDKARLIYWDRSGAVVTKSFSYVKEDWLAQFFWRYTLKKDDPGFRGIDTSVTVPTENDAADVQKARLHLELSPDAPVLKFAIPDEGGDVSYCFGSKPRFKANYSPTGRATRVFSVYDPGLERVVLMKDTWRVSLDGMQAEGAIYKRLKDAGVSHIPDFLRGGDLPGPSRTRSHKFAKRFHLKLRPYTHYRFTLNDIGRDLTSFTTTKELVKAIADALRAHTEAFEKAGILHRDISVGNIIITDRGGLLIDWDLAKDVADLRKTSRQPFRTGTWQFISAKLLQAQEPMPHTPEDDLESFFHVLSWVALRFTKHGLSSAILTYVLEHMYDSAYMDGGKVIGGVVKQSFMKSRYISNDAKLPPGPLCELLGKLVDVCTVCYENPTSASSYTERYGKLNAKSFQEMFKEAVESSDWPEGLDSQRVVNPLDQPKRKVFTTKRESEVGHELPAKRRKLDLGDKDELWEDIASVEGTQRDEAEGHISDDYAVVALCDQASTDWEDEEDPIDLLSASNAN